MGKKEHIVRYTRDQIRNLPDRTDWKRVNAMRDKDIDTSDIPELGAEFWKYAKLVMPHKKKSVGLRIDDDLYSWFKKRGRGYQSQINAILRAYMFAQMDQEKR